MNTFAAVHSCRHYPGIVMVNTFDSADEEEDDESDTRTDDDEVESKKLRGMNRQMMKMSWKL